MFDDVQHRPSKYRKVTEAMMRGYAEKGWTLERMSSSKIMDRSIRTLQMWAREFGLRFPDYVPYELRTPEERKRK